MTLILLFGLLAAGANLLGGLILIKSGAHRYGERFLKYLVALGAGFMLAAIFIEILPETVDIWTQTFRGESTSEAVAGAMTLLLAGYLSIQFFEHTLAPHFHFGAETHPESFMRPSAAYTAVGGLWIHTFFDGVSIASAFLVNFKVGILVFIAILLHKMPEGFTVASIMLASGRSTRKALIATAAIGAATLAGVIGVVLLETRMSDAVAYALPFSAGVTLYVAASDLIPEVNHKEERNPTVSIVVFGCAGMSAMRALTRGATAAIARRARESMRANGTTESVRTSRTLTAGTSPGTRSTTPTARPFDLACTMGTPGSSVRMSECVCPLTITSTARPTPRARSTISPVTGRLLHRRRRRRRAQRRPRGARLAPEATARAQ